MSNGRIPTQRLELILQTRDEVLAYLDGMPPGDRAEVSPQWLRMLEKSEHASPWIHDFTMTLNDSGLEVGRCGFKAPPETDGVVKIAYGVSPEHQGRGYATEAAAALVAFAMKDERIVVVRAHTLPERNASTRVLGKCGFHKVGEVVDPEDGLVWRWEIVRDA